MIFFEKRTDLFSYSKKDKDFFFNNSIFRLVNFHYKNCVNYKKAGNTNIKLGSPYMVYCVRQAFIGRSLSMDKCCFENVHVTLC